MDSLRNPTPIADNDYMRFGREQEASLIEKLSTQFDLEPNDWLIAKDDSENRWQMATPDGLSPGHELIAEVKTTGRDWGEWRAVPGHYQRQVQWQLYVTGATSCVFGWMLRTTRQGDMVPAWPGPKFVVVNRDEALIEKLIGVAENLYRELPLASS
jgi:predicted phage-related endonuclease